MSKDLFSAVVRIVHSWWPNHSYRRETRYRDDLFGFLTKKLGAMVETESRGERCDIVVNGEVGIELKRNLHTSTQVDGLIGQLKRYLRSYPSGLIVVLVGKTEDSRRTKLLNRVRDLSSRGPISMGLSRPRRIEVVDKGGGAVKKRRRKGKKRRRKGKKRRRKEKKPAGIFDVLDDVSRDVFR